MKKVFLPLICLLTTMLLECRTTVFAQKHADLSIRIISPAEGQSIPSGDTVNIVVSIKNLGPAAIDTTDTIFSQMVGFPIGTSILGQSIPVGDSFVYRPIGWTNGVSADSSYTFCVYIDKNLNTNFTDTNQSNDSSCVTFLLKGKHTNGISKAKVKTPLLTLYPNPAHSTVFLPLQLNQPEKVSALVMDVTGRCLIRTADEIETPSTKALRLDVSGLQPGIYFVELQQGFQRQIGKLVIE